MTSRRHSPHHPFAADGARSVGADAVAGSDAGGTGDAVLAARVARRAFIRTAHPDRGGDAEAFRAGLAAHTTRLRDAEHHTIADVTAAVAAADAAVRGGPLRVTVVARHPRRRQWSQLLRRRRPARRLH